MSSVYLDDLRGMVKKQTQKIIRYLITKIFSFLRPMSLSLTHYHIALYCTFSVCKNKVYLFFWYYCKCVSITIRQHLYQHTFKIVQRFARPSNKTNQSYSTWNKQLKLRSFLPRWFLQTNPK